MTTFLCSFIEFFVVQEISNRPKKKHSSMAAIDCILSHYIFFFFLVSYVEERLWWPIKAPTKEERRKRTAKRRERLYKKINLGSPLFLTSLYFCELLPERIQECLTV